MQCGRWSPPIPSMKLTWRLEIIDLCWLSAAFQFWQVRQLNLKDLSSSGSGQSVYSARPHWFQPSTSQCCQMTLGCCTRHKSWSSLHPGTAPSGWLQINRRHKYLGSQSPPAYYRRSFILCRRRGQSLRKFHRTCWAGSSWWEPSFPQRRHRQARAWDSLVQTGLVLVRWCKVYLLANQVALLVIKGYQHTLVAAHLVSMAAEAKQAN